MVVGPRPACGSEAALVQAAPEEVARAGVVVADASRGQTGVDPDEEDFEAGAREIGEAPQLRIRPAASHRR